MIPILFDSTAETFTSQGLGALTDTVVGYVDEERNGQYEGYIKYPVTGIHYNEIALRSIILAKPNYTDDPQPLRVYRISKPINGIVTIYFKHIIQDLSGYPATPFTATTLSTALSGLTSNCPISCPFTLTTSRSVTATFKADVPASIRSWMGGKSGSILDVYGGEWAYNGYTATLYTNRGQDRGVTIRYGKNLVDLTQEENCAAVYTGVYPFWTDSYGGNLQQITGLIVNNTETSKYSGATYDYTKILPVDFSDRWDTPPTNSQLRDAAISYIESNELGTPKVNLKVEFAQLSNSIKDRVDLCDTVKIQFEKLGVSATAKCIKTRWNILLDRYEEITLGDAKTTLAETIVTTKKTAEKAITSSTLENAVDSATAQISGNAGGYVVLHDSDGDDQPDEILVMDEASISAATKIWRWNKSGLGYSSNGYSGPYGLAITQDGAIVANAITSGWLNADVIKAGIIQDRAGLNYWNMATGEISINATGVVQSITTYYAESVENSAPQWDYPKAYLVDANNADLYDANGDRLVAKTIWRTAPYTTSSSNYRWMRNYIVYKDGTTELTSPVPLQDYYGRANLVFKMSTDSDNNPIGIISGEADYIVFNAGQLRINSPQFKLDRDGNATFSGNLSAASGTFAGSLSSATGSFSGAVTATSLTLGSGVTVPYSKVSDTPDLTVYVEQGKQYGSAASSTTTGFKLTSAGLLTASNAVIYGSIYATSLTLGTGVSIGASKVSGLASVATSGSASDVSGLASVATSGSYNDLSNKPTIPSLTGYIYVDGTIGSTPAAGATGFVVSSAGALQASNAIIYGSLYSSTGTIGGMTLASNAIYNGTNSMTSTTAGVYLGTGGLRIYGSSSKYINATSSGDVTVKGGEISGGTITGSTFKSNDGTTQLDNDGITLRDAATDALSLKRLQIKLETVGPTLIYSYRSSTAGTWTYKRPIGWMSSGSDIYGFKGTFWELEAEGGLVCNSYRVVRINSGESGAHVSGTTVRGERIYVGDHTTEIGATLSAQNTSSVSATSGASVNVCSITLKPGTWVVTAQYHCPVSSNDNFRVIAAISTASGDYQLQAGGYNNIPVINPPSTVVAGALSRIITVSANTTVYLTLNQNSGGTKTLTANRSRIDAVCIA